MSALRASVVEGALVAKGFDRIDRSHRVFQLVVDGQKTGVATHTSHNSQAIDDHLQRLMARQIHLPTDDFVRLVECTLSGQDYAAKMIEEGHVVLRGATPAKPTAKSKGKPGKGAKGSKKRK